MIHRCYVRGGSWGGCPSDVAFGSHPARDLAGGSSDVTLGLQHGSRRSMVCFPIALRLLFLLSDGLARAGRESVPFDFALGC